MPPMANTANATYDQNCQCRPTQPIPPMANTANATYGQHSQCHLWPIQPMPPMDNTTNAAAERLVSFPSAGRAPVSILGASISYEQGGKVRIRCTSLYTSTYAELARYAVVAEPDLGCWSCYAWGSPA